MTEFRPVIPARERSPTRARVVPWHFHCSTEMLPATELTLKPLPHPSRLSFATVLCAAVFALWPAEARAQHHGHFHSSFVVAPVYFGYGYGFGYYSPFWWGYGGFYPYGGTRPTIAPRTMSWGSDRRACR